LSSLKDMLTSSTLHPDRQGGKGLVGPRDARSMGAMGGREIIDRAGFAAEEQTIADRARSTARLIGKAHFA